MALLQYANWYKSIYGMPLDSRPDDDVIQDDARLDVWFDTFVRDMSRKAGRRGDPKYDFIGEASAPVPEFGV